MAFIRGAREGITVSARRGKARSRTATALFLVLVTGPLIAASYPAHAGDLDKIVLFNIEAETLDKALLEFGTQAHMQIMFAWDSSTAGLRTHALKGRYTGKEALEEILKGTRLRYVSRGRTLEILPQVLANPRPSARASKSFGAQHQSAPEDSGAPIPLIPDPPVPQSSGQSTQSLGEVIVTAQKYSQAAFDVPISLDVISGTDLLEHGITDLSNLQYDVPGLYMNSSGYSHSVYIRGVANDSGNGAVVGQYIDEADITAEDTSGQAGLATGDVGLYDLNRVEVLKGPQGTLYGDGSLGGVIRYITNRPALDAFEMNADMVDMITEYGAPSQRIESMLNTPIVSRVFGLRFAGIFEHDGGWVDEPVASLKNINGSNLADVRVEALWQPTSRLTVNAMQIVHRHTSGLGMGEDSSGNITPVFGTTLTPNQADNSNISNMTLSYDFANLRVLSSSTYLSEDQQIHNLMNSEAFGSETFWFLYPIYNSKNRDSSEELRLVRADSGPWQWTVGGFYKRFRDQIYYSNYSGFSGSTLSSAFFSPATPYGDTSTSRAVFANTSYRVFERLTVGAGVRYYSDRETTFPPLQAATFTSTDPRFYVQYQATPHLNVYASASKGFRSGGFNAFPEPTYKPENLWSYDLGSKVRLPAEGLRFDVDVFYMNYSNFVNITYVPPLYEGTNIGKARIKGVDADLTWRLVDLWQFSLNAEILNTDLLTASAISGYVAGDRIPFAPTYSLAASVARDFHVEDKPGDIELYYYEISRVQDRSLGSPLEQSDIQRYLNLRAAIHWSDSLELGLFAHNLFNDRSNESPWASIGQSVRPRPRTFGVEFNVRFR